MARKACHNADPPCISSTVAPPQHGTQDANTVCRTPPPCCNANTLHRTLPPCHSQHGMQNIGAAVGMVVVVDSGMAVAGMAAMVRHSYYLRLYIFYLFNKLILFLYFVIKANDNILLLSITDVKSNNNK